MEMIKNNQRYQDFWVYVTIYEEEEDRGGKIQNLGYKFYRDYGDDCYRDYIKHVGKKAYVGGIINYEDYCAIT
eukprot:12793692-Heterocapsa_arctica.AAC.1